MSRLAVLLALVCLVGCASSPFVGRWEAKELDPKISSEAKATSATMVLNEDKTCSLSLNNEKGASLFGTTGTWEPVNKSQCSFTYLTGPKAAVGMLENNDTLLMSETKGSGGVAIRFHRAE